MTTENLSISFVFPTISTDLSDMEANMETLVNMGFTDQALNRQVLMKVENDIVEAITMLCSSNYTYDDLILPTASTTTTFNGSSAEENTITFDKTAYLNLESSVNIDNWSTPYQHNDNLARCLVSATKLARLGVADQDEDCQKFMKITIHTVFQKLHDNYSIHSWSSSVQFNILQITELLIDLIAARLSYSPIPIELLGLLATIFYQNSSFQQKNKTMLYTRSLYDQQFGKRLLAEPPLESTLHGRNESYGWLCQLINRFVLKNGVENLKNYFRNQQSLSAIEYCSLLTPFASCIDCIIIDQFRQLFGEEIKQVLNYMKNFKEEDFEEKLLYSLGELPCVLRRIFFVVWPYRLSQVRQIIEIWPAYDSTRIPSKYIPLHIIRKWIIDYSIVSKALEGDLQDERYVYDIQELIKFIVSNFERKDIETIWKVQQSHSLTNIDQFFILIIYSAKKFDPAQINYLVEFIYKSWKIETALMQEKLVELLGVIGRESGKESVIFILETLWNMAHESNLDRSMFDRILNCHLRTFIEGRSLYIELKRDYCLKCIADLQKKQDWVIPAIKYLYELLRQNLTNIFVRLEQDLLSLLIDKHGLIDNLIQSLSVYQAQGLVTKETTIDTRFTYEESVKIHLDLISFLLKKANLYLILRRAEELWDTLITNEKASSIDRELGFEWFINYIDDLSQTTQKILFETRISKLDSIDSSENGTACLKLYSERCTQSTNKKSSLGISIALNA